MGPGLRAKILIGTIIFIGLSVLRPLAAYADTTYTFSCPESSIKGTISYTVIGMYRSIFRECSGKIVYDSLKSQIKSVELNIVSASIKSSCQWCDDIVTSKQILNAAAYPVITFKSKNFENKEHTSWAWVLLNLHGVAKNYRFPFELKEKNDNTLFIKGVWKFNRKNFDIIWNKFLDYGGILVGDYFTVDWQVKAHRI